MCQPFRELKPSYVNPITSYSNPKEKRTSFKTKMKLEIKKKKVSHTKGNIFKQRASKTQIY